MTARAAGQLPGTLILIRGLPGSGKTSLAYRMVGESGRMVAADDFMRGRVPDAAGGTRDGYLFDPARLGEVHSKCQAQVRDWMIAHNAGERRCSPIVVHNTFCQQWEAEPYLSLAREHGFHVQVVTAEGPWENQHGVPAAAIEAMRARWESSATWPYDAEAEERAAYEARRRAEYAARQAARTRYAGAPRYRGDE